MTKPEVQIVVAVADNGVIGHKGKLPWHLPKDLRHFKATTMGAPMIMGRKTFESLPALLPGRKHIVLTNDGAWWRNGIEVVHSVEEALERVDAPKVSIIGGGEIYREFLPYTDRIFLTEVHLEPEGDAYFPELHENEWITVRGGREPAEGQYPAHTFLIKSRRAKTV